MKKSYWTALVLILSVFASSCKKSHESTTNPNNGNPVGQTTGYRVEGIKDIYVINDADNNICKLNLSVNDTAKMPENIKLALEGWPDACYGYLSTDSANGNYTTTLTVNNSGASPGVYPIRLNCTGSLSGKISYTFNLNILSTTDDANFFLGTGAGTRGTQHLLPYTDYITKGDTAGKIIFSNFSGLGISIYANISGDAKKQVAPMKIPLQTIDNKKYFGDGWVASGKITHDKTSFLYYNYSVVSSTGDTTSEYVEMTITH
ncbi:hypothetical protein [Taibaiella soli]|uniref:Uncharacterized protein n=1 Tax=Taibaiella soli TaxID=1649169 RepID=A0A2W2B999_9BACT|nr:hypothetical protein [Taibaiella soli]PZF72487.1 hypothetical protein DN068_11520 [Taibaiella soli]